MNTPTPHLRHRWNDGCLIIHKAKKIQWRLQWCKCGKERVKPKSKQPTDMNTPTPRTDAEHAQFPMGGFTLDFARRLERELTAVTKQRDRMAEALKMIATFDYDDLQCDNGYGARFVAREALQSLNQPTEQ